MATLAAVARERKGQLKSLILASRKLDAAQESLEREAKRLVARRQAVPEVADAARLISLAQATSGALDNMIALLESLARAWTSI